VRLHEEVCEVSPAALTVEFLGDVRNDLKGDGGGIHYKLLLLYQEEKRAVHMLAGLLWGSCLGMGGDISWRVLLSRGVSTGLGSVPTRYIAGNGA